MIGPGRWYRYVGPDELLRTVDPSGGGHRVDSQAAFADWIAGIAPADLGQPFTFVVDTGGTLRLAPRRSEHVACAGSGPVLAAGEIGFRHDPAGWTVNEVSNQSTGYCPDGASWPAVAAACCRAGLGHPGDWTAECVFRRCPDCQQRNLVKDGDFSCAVCGADLPPDWNVDSSFEAPAG